MSKISTPLSYQGGKSRIASNIVDHIYKGIDHHYYDLCSGGGSISIELFNRGVSPENITMVEMGPMGYFWKAVGESTFDLDRFERVIEGVPRNPHNIRDYLKEVSNSPVNSLEECIYDYLIIQAGSFGGKQIWVSDGKFRNCSFRSYWQPTPTSSRRSPVNPMMPMPSTLLRKVEDVCESMVGINVVTEDVINFKPNVANDCVVYFDPPYEGTTGYGYNTVIDDVVDYWKNQGIWVSEYRKLSDEFYVMSNTNKGGISGNSKKKNVEVLNYVKV